MATLTTNMHLTKPTTAESADITVINENMNLLDQHRHGGGLDGLAVRAVQAGLYQDLPQQGTAGQLYVATDIPALYIDSGSAWVLASQGEIEVVAKSNTTPNGVITIFNIGSGVAAKKVEVRKNGLVKVDPDDYTFTVGNTYVTFVAAPLTGDLVVMKYVAA